MTTMQILQRMSGKSQKELGEFLNIPRRTISDQCKKGVNTEKFLDYCERLDIDPKEVINYRQNL
jgi:DNA-binding CsgD family transcriptional regulator